MTKTTELELKSICSSRHQELLAFIFLTVVFMPMLSVFLVGGYGLIIWLKQIFL